MGSAAKFSLFSEGYKRASAEVLWQRASMFNWLRMPGPACSGGRLTGRHIAADPSPESGAEIAARARDEGNAALPIIHRVNDSSRKERPGGRVAQCRGIVGSSNVDRVSAPD